MDRHLTSGNAAHKVDGSVPLIFVFNKSMTWP